MVLLSEIGQPTFVEVIRVDPFEGLTCEPRAILGNSRWQNPINRFDVNGDGVVDESDYNTLLTWIGQHGPGTLPALKPSSDPWVDITGNGAVDNGDLQQLYNYLTGSRDESNLTCYRVSDFRIERDLLDPAQIINCNTQPTVRAAACHKNIIPTANYTPYFKCGTGLLETTWDAVVKTKDIILYVHNDLLIPRNPYFAGCSDTPRVLNRILKRLQADPIPYKYNPNCRVWPNWPDTSGWKPGDVGTPVEIPDEPILPELPPPEVPTTTIEPTPGLLERVVIINVLSNAGCYLVVEPWYANSSARVMDGPRGFEASGSHYVDDRTLWDQFIDSIEDNGFISVRVGIVHPRGTGEVWPTNKQLPKDSYRTQIDYIPFDFKSPRISTSNLVNVFNIITQNGQFDPTLLIFVSDKAEDALWRSPINKAGRQLADEYPRMQVVNYPFSKPFHRWIMMDLDAMLQLAYQRDNINTNLNSAYRISGTEGLIEDAISFRAMRQSHIEYRLVNNDATVNWFEITMRDDHPPFPSQGPIGGIPVPTPPQQQPAGYNREPKGKTQACYAIMNPFGWSFEEQIAGTGSSTSTPARRRLSFTSNPFFTFQQRSFENGIYSQNYMWAASIVATTFAVVEANPPLFGAPNPISRDYIAYRHATSKIYDPPSVSFNWMPEFFAGIQQDIRVGTFSAQLPSQVPDGLADTVEPINVVDVYPVTHLDHGYGILAGVGPSGGGYFVSVWYNDLHAVVTEGPIRGPRTKDHFIRNKTEDPVWEERQRAIVLYSDPDFQDKIYAAVKYYFEQDSVYHTFGWSDRPFNMRGWIAAGAPWLSTSSLTFLMLCPEFPVIVATAPGF